MLPEVGSYWVAHCFKKFLKACVLTELLLCAKFNRFVKACDVSMHVEFLLKVSFLSTEGALLLL